MWICMRVLAVLLASLVVQQSAWAQVVLEEIVVTAQKRAQPLQDVPLSVLAVDGERLRAQVLARPETLAARLPNVHVSEAALGDKLFIRGIGSGINPGFEQAVGTFVDGIYQGRGPQSRGRFLDVESVEVLRGPQSTYFGNNAIAGALNVSTRRPDGKVSGYLNSLREFHYGEYQLEAAAGVALNETLALRVAGLASGLEGWLRERDSGQRSGNERNRAARLAFAYHPHESFDATLRVDAGRFTVAGRNLQVFACPPSSGAAGTCALALAVLPDLAASTKRETWYQGEPPAGFSTAVDRLGAAEAGHAIPAPAEALSAPDQSRLVNEGIALTLHWRGPARELIAISGISGYDSRVLQGADFVPLPLASVNQHEHYRQYSQELRLTRTDRGRFDYVAGVYLQHSTLGVNENIDFYLPPPFFQPAATWFDDDCRAGAAENQSCRWPATLAGSGSRHHQREYSAGLFGVLSWHINDQLQLNFGARHATSRKTLARQQTLRDHAPGVTVTCTTGVSIQGCKAGQPLLLASAGPPAGSGFAWRAGTLALTRKDAAFTPSVSLQWFVRPKQQWYLAYTEGFKAGGFDQRNLLLAADSGQFAPESVRSWELGLKTVSPGAALQLNLALFHGAYRDLQVSTFDGVVNFLVNNAASARSRGLETELRWQLGESLRLGVAAALLDARWLSFPEAQCTALDLAQAPNPGCQVSAVSGLLVQDLSGQPLPMAPRWSGNLSLDWQGTLSGGMQMQLALLLYGAGAQYLAADNDPATLAPRNLKVDMRIALVDRRGWELALVGRNLGKRLSAAHAEDLPLGAVNSFFRLLERPRTFALQAQYRW
jgi:iron complex outermembrane recepter protein